MPNPFPNLSPYQTHSNTPSPKPPFHLSRAACFPHFLSSLFILPLKSPSTLLTIPSTPQSLPVLTKFFLASHSPFLKRLMRSQSRNLSISVPFALPTPLSSLDHVKTKSLLTTPSITRALAQTSLAKAQSQKAWRTVSSLPQEDLGQVGDCTKLYRYKMEHTGKHLWRLNQFRSLSLLSRPRACTPSQTTDEMPATGAGLPACLTSSYRCL
ncbi:uncharacterized protein LOC127914403 [Oncorhynchus keta]|uniref:uncharacterized protein LOC127914403 n=1 Tax=Oncorhynchus keta TaxID=8018 RepID=UPI00227D1126|nr:uncharacterized protein LOC127914403 [Oncorhynchus keta]